MPDQKPSIDCDVTVIGGGLAGKAASLHLARAGLAVVCIEPQQAVRPPVGESLDWSAPDLLNRLGLSPESLIASRSATWKRHVTLKMRDGCDMHYIPSAWLGGPPFYVNLTTLHVERTQLDDELLKMVVDQGVTFLRDRVVDLETADQKICWVQTEGGVRVSSPWLIDASGIGASLVAKKFNLPSLQYGPTKVAIWTYFRVPQQVEGTTLYMDPRPAEYLEWIGLLRGCVAFEAYCKVCTAELKPERIADFILLQPEFPYSVRYALDRMHHALTSISNRSLSRRTGKIERLIGRLRSAVTYVQIGEVIRGDLHMYLAAIIEQCRDLHAAVHEVYIEYPIEVAFES